MNGSFLSKDGEGKTFILERLLQLLGGIVCIQKHIEVITSHAVHCNRFFISVFVVQGQHVYGTHKVHAGIFRQVFYHGLHGKNNGTLREAVVGRQHLFANGIIHPLE